MKCRFELILAGGSPDRLRAVGEEALEEIERLGKQLNFYSPSSLLSRLNRDASKAPVAVDARLYELLAVCRDIHRRTEGAFDPTISPLLEAWGFSHRRGRRPSPAQIEDALKRVGFDKVLMNDEDRTICLAHGATLNLSSIAKGYALDCAADILREHGIGNALLHGGTSSILALGQPSVAASPPYPRQHPARAMAPQDTRAGWTVEVADPRDEDRSLLRRTLRDEALSASGNHLNALRLKDITAPGANASSATKDRQPEERPARIGHVIDPRSGHPVEHTFLAAVATDFSAPLPAARADAYATAALVDRQLHPRWRGRLKLLHRTSAC